MAGKERFRLRTRLKQPNYSENSSEMRDDIDIQSSKNRRESQKSLTREARLRNDAARNKRYRQSMTPEQKERYNEKVKQRMRKYRKRMKEQNRQPKTTHKVSTRQQQERQREYWRKKKQAQRQNQSSAQKERILLRRRERYEVLSARRRLAYTPTDKSNTRDNIRQKESQLSTKETTPTKREQSSGKDIFASLKNRKYETALKLIARIKQKLAELRRMKTKDARKKHRFLTRTIAGKYATENAIRKEFNLRWQYWRRISYLEEDTSPRRSDALSEETRNHIEQFYLNESTPLPHRKQVSTKTWKQKSVMTDTIQHAHARFLRHYPEVKVSLSLFRKLRPKEVLTVHAQKFQSCLCEYCLNVQHKIDAIAKLADKLGKSDMKIADKYQCVEDTMCAKLPDREYHNMECINRKCSHCGVKNLKSKYGDELRKQEVCWKKWERTSMKGALGKSSKRQILIDKLGTLGDLLDELCEEVHTLSSHLFVARWQYKRFKELTENLPNGMIVTIADFSENYRCVYQDQISAVFYSYEQVTIHPMISYYSCPDCKEATVQEAAVFITPDLLHDSFAVNHFTQTLDDHIKGRSVEFDYEVQFSDGCAAQYKSKRPFQHITEMTGHRFERAYFGSRHGKGPCDALGGVVKKQAENHVKRRNGQIRNAKEFYDFCKENMTIGCGKLCEHKRRSFFYVEHIQRPSPEVPQALRPLKGTHSVHSVRGQSPGVIQARALSCFCPLCISHMNHSQYTASDTNDCHNIEYVGQWLSHDLKPKTTMKGWSRTVENNRSNQTDGMKHSIRKRAPSKYRKTTTGKCKMSKMSKECAERHLTNTKTSIRTKQFLKSQFDGTKPFSAGNKQSAQESCTGVKRRKVPKTSETSPPSSQGCNVTLTQLQECVGLPEIQALLTVYNPRELPEPPTNLSIVDLGKIIDKFALELLPGDIPLEEEKLYPVCISDDGSCLPHCGSLYAYGHEDNHEDIRIRIVQEMACNVDYYIGANKATGSVISRDTAKLFASLSQYFGPGDQISDTFVNTIYEREVLGATGSSSYMGVWQVAALASVLQREIVSVYPDYGGHTVKHDIHRVFPPRTKAGKALKPVHIMWTNTRGKSIAEIEWQPNHFVCLLPMYLSPSTMNIPEDIVVQSTVSNRQSEDSSILVKVHPVEHCEGLHDLQALCTKADDELALDEADPAYDVPLNSSSHGASQREDYIIDSLSQQAQGPLSSLPAALEQSYVAHNSASNLSHAIHIAAPEDPHVGFIQSDGVCILAVGDSSGDVNQIYSVPALAPKDTPSDLGGTIQGPALDDSLSDLYQTHSELEINPVAPLRYLNQTPTPTVPTPEVSPSDLSQTLTVTVTKPKNTPDDLSQAQTGPVIIPEGTSNEVSMINTVSVHAPDDPSNYLSQTCIVPASEDPSSDLSSTHTVPVPSSEYSSGYLSQTNIVPVPASGDPSKHLSQISVPNPEDPSRDLSQTQVPASAPNHSFDLSQPHIVLINMPENRSDYRHETHTVSVSAQEGPSSDLSGIDRVSVPIPEYLPNDLSETQTFSVPAPLEGPSNDPSQTHTVSAPALEGPSSDLSGRDRVSVLAAEPSGDLSHHYTLSVTMRENLSDDLSETHISSVPTADDPSSDLGRTDTVLVPQEDHSNDFSLGDRVPVLARENPPTDISQTHTVHISTLVHPLDLCQTPEIYMPVLEDHSGALKQTQTVPVPALEKPAADVSRNHTVPMLQLENTHGALSQPHRVPIPAVETPTSDVTQTHAVTVPYPVDPSSDRQSSTVSLHALDVHPSDPTQHHAVLITMPENLSDNLHETNMVSVPAQEVPSSDLGGNDSIPVPIPEYLPNDLSDTHSVSVHTLGAPLEGPSNDPSQTHTVSAPALEGPSSDPSGPDRVPVLAPDPSGDLSHHYTLSVTMRENLSDDLSETHTLSIPAPNDPSSDLGRTDTAPVLAPEDISGDPSQTQTIPVLAREKPPADTSQTHAVHVADPSDDLRQMHRVCGLVIEDHSNNLKQTHTAPTPALENQVADVSRTHTVPVLQLEKPSSALSQPHKPPVEYPPSDLNQTHPSSVPTPEDPSSDLSKTHRVSVATRENPSGGLSVTHAVCVSTPEDYRATHAAHIPHKDHNSPFMADVQEEVKALSLMNQVPSESLIIGENLDFTASFDDDEDASFDLENIISALEESDETPRIFKKDDNICVKHGKEVLRAIVVEESGTQLSVKFYKPLPSARFGKRSSLQDEVFTIDGATVLNKIDAPACQSSGRRRYYSWASD